MKINQMKLAKLALAVTLLTGSYAVNAQTSDSQSATNQSSMMSMMSTIMGQGVMDQDSMNSMMNTMMSQNTTSQDSSNSMMNSSMMNGGMMNQGMMSQNSMNNMMNNMMGHGMMGMHDEAMTLKQSTQAPRPLAIPPLLKGTPDGQGRMVYNVTAQSGETDIKDGQKTATYGYNGSVLGPALLMRSGEKVTINLTNNLPEKTTFHWHGLAVRSDVDGGPHYPIAANGGTGKVEFTVNQPAGTAWFHPHAMGLTASQVYKGLAGLIVIQDEQSDKLNLPHEYGVDDIPVAIQDRLFTKDNQWDYKSAYSDDGVYGDTLVVNGTINPYVEVPKKLVRLRLLDGSNARNMTLRMSDGSTMYQIASDGGLLEKPVPMEQISLVPGERAEVLVDFSRYENAAQLPSLVMQNGANGTVNVVEFRKGATWNTDAVTSTNSTIPTWDFETKKHDEEIQKAASTDKIAQHIVMSGMAKDVTINGKKFSMDRIDLTAKLGSTEVWDISNSDGMMGMIHPFHIHGVQFEVVSRNGVPVTPDEKGLKDTISVAPGEDVRIRIHFTQPGVFMVHCHILEHEENGMMLQLLVK